MNTLGYVFLFIEACTLHRRHNLPDKYSILTVDDIFHFFVVVEIVTFANTCFVVMIYLLMASIINEKQLEEEEPSNTTLERSSEPEELTVSQN